MSESEGPLIAVDMDDVPAMTNENLVEWHNRNHGSDMTLEDCHYFHEYFTKRDSHRIRDTKTPETLNKLKVYHRSRDFRNLKPVPYAAKGLAGLKSLGFRAYTCEWLNANAFEEIICTSTFSKSGPEAMKENPWAGKSKAEVIKTVGAVLLIDDSLENASTCAAAGIHVLLFGDYPWSQRQSRTSTPQDMMSRAERIRSGDDKFWEREVVTDLPPMVRRVGSWQDVVAWAKEEGKDVVGRQQAPLEDLEALGEGVRV
ncbi:hypothetical protein FRC00_008666 [Tulasnella sp. 408]|nr:hypothetical protein FRC00_008666 [Tulasnella sp. 408]